MIGGVGKIRVLIAKVGLDAHDTGAVVVSHLLRDAGMEVIYLGIHNTVEQVVVAAQQEGVDVIGLSFLGGDHLYHTRRLMEQLKKAEEKQLVLVGGVIPRSDICQLKDMGVAMIFGPGTGSAEVVKFIEGNVERGSVVTGG